MNYKISTASTVDLEALAQIYCSWLPESVADLMYKDIIQNNIPPEELAGLFGLPKEECASLLNGGVLVLSQPIYAHPLNHSMN